jgi:hypothetical protein
VAAAALKALDDSEYPFEMSFRMYGIVGRAGDLTMVEPLVAAIEKMESVRSRRIELPTLESALSDLTYAPIGQRAPWQDWEEPSRKRVATEAAAWRSFMTAHPTLDRAALLAERLTDARAHLDDADVNRAYFAALFLTKSPDTQEEGRKALQALVERKRLPPGAREEIREVLRRLKPANSKTVPKPVEDPKTLRS